MTSTYRGLASGLLGLALVSATALPAFCLSFADHKQAIIASQGSATALRSAIAEYPEQLRTLVDLANQAGGSYALVLRPNGKYELITIPADTARLPASNGSGGAYSAPLQTSTAGGGMSMGLAGGLAGLAAGAAILGSQMGGGSSGGSGDGSNSTPSTYEETPTAEILAISQEYDNLDLGLSHAGTEFQVSAGASRLGAGSADRIHPYTRLGAYAAYEQDYTGRGSKIAVFDGGFSLLHQELIDKDLSLSDVADPWRMTGASADHGTQVAAIAAGTKDDLGMHGVAYDADLHLAQYSISVSLYDELVQELITEGVDVWNNSWTYQAQPFVSGIELKENHNVEISEMVSYANQLGDASLAMSQVLGSSADDWSNFVTAIGDFQLHGGQAGKGGVVVWANTNYGQSLYDVGYDIDPLNDAALVSALPSLYPELEGAWITAVNATDIETAKIFLGSQTQTISDKSADGSIALVSAQCGSAAAYCLAADGVQVASATSGEENEYQNSTGTSLAAPMITGSVAVLRQAFPNLTAKDLTTRLFVTADNSVTGDQDGTAVFTTQNGQTYSHGYSYLFGHGFLDLQAALAPIGGTVAKASAGGTDFALDQGQSQIILASAFGSGLESDLEQASFMAQDEMGAGFELNLAGFTQPMAPDYLSGRLDAWLAGSSKTQIKSDDTVSISFNANFDAQASIWESDLQLAVALTDDTSVSFGLGSDANAALLGFEVVQDHSLAGGLEQDAQALDYLSFSDDSMIWGAYSSQVGDDQLTLTAFHNTRQDYNYASFGIVARQSGQIGDEAQAQFTAGTVMETGGLLGSPTSGAFANQSAVTSFVQLAASKDLKPGLSLSATYALGHSQVQSYTDTLLQDYSALYSSSFSVGLTAQNLVADDSRWTVSLSSPTRVISGSTKLKAMSGYAWDNQTALYQSQDINLAPEGRELRLGFGYDQQLDEARSWQAGLIATFQAGHDTQAKTQVGGYLGFKKVF